MGKAKWIILIILWIPPLTPIGFLVTYGMANLYLFLFLFGLLVLRPLKYFFSSVKRFERKMMDGVEEVKESPLKFGLVALLFFLLFTGGATSSLLDLASGEIGAALPIVFSLFLTALSTVLVALGYRHFSEADAVELAESPARQAAGTAAGTAAQGAERAIEASAAEEDFAVAMAKGLVEEVPLIGEAAEAEAAAAGLSALAPYLADAFFVMLIGEVIFLGLVYFLLLPAIGGIFGASLGAAGAYANLFGTQAANRVLPGLGQVEAIEQTGAMVSQTAAKIGCFAKGPACFRQWQLNNTKRPGSEDVGEQYGLKIDSFRVGQGEELDVAYKDPDYALPISFTLSNPRHGLKGLNAENVSYRLVVKDASKTYCDTGWQPVNAFTIRKPEDGTVDKGDTWYGNDIYPGTSASTGFQTLADNDNGDDFTLAGCKMLQPGLGGYKTVMLEVKYNYFSQSTLYFEAMSLQSFQSNPNIQKKVKKSKTADTPVKASINANSPVLYDENELPGKDASQPFAVRASLDTEEQDLRYKVRSLKVRNSQETTVYSDEESECQFTGFGGGMLELKSTNENDAQSKIISSESGRQLWFTREQKPPIFGCVMILEEPRDISATGETLTMGVEAEYTVALGQKIEGFKAYNSRCSAKYNCPLLVTKQYAEKDPIGYSENGKDSAWFTKCSGVDAGNGCSVLEGPRSEGGWSRELMTGNGEGYLDKELESGEVALEPSEIVKQKNGVKAGKAIETDAAIGLRQSKADVIESGEEFSVFVAGAELEPELVELERKCNGKYSNRKKFLEDELDVSLEQVVMYRVKKCSGSS